MKASKTPTVKVVPSRHSKSSTPDIVVFHLGKESPTWRTLRKEVETGSSWKIEWKRASNVSEAARESRLIQFAPGSEKTSGLASVLVSVKEPIRDVDVPILMEMLVDGVPVIVAKGAINDAIWTLKSEATRLALPFEVAESRASFWHLILASHSGINWRCGCSPRKNGRRAAYGPSSTRSVSLAGNRHEGHQGDVERRLD